MTVWGRILSETVYRNENNCGRRICRAPWILGCLRMLGTRTSGLELGSGLVLYPQTRPLWPLHQIFRSGKHRFLRNPHGWSRGPKRRILESSWAPCTRPSLHNSPRPPYSPGPTAAFTLDPALWRLARPDWTNDPAASNTPSQFPTVIYSSCEPPVRKLAARSVRGHGCTYIALGFDLPRSTQTSTLPVHLFHPNG